MNDKSKQYVYGVHAVKALLDNRAHDIVEFYVTERRDQRVQSLVDIATNAGLRITRVDKKRLDEWVGEQHQGVAVKIKKSTTAPAWNEQTLYDNLASMDKPLLLILDGVTDPHNLGACLRSADAAGVAAVIAPKDKSVGLTPVVCKVASGAAESIPFVQVTNLARCLKELQDAGIWIVGTCGDADKTIFDVDLRGAVAIVMGAEGDGMRRLTREHCDFLAKIPMNGAVSSLNVSVATGVCLFEAVRQRKVN